MNHFLDCHREERSDVAIQLIDCSRGLPQSPRLLRNDKQSEFIYRSAATKQSSWIATARSAPRDDKPGLKARALHRVSLAMTNFSRISP
jgi:hypothetical protein